jgi:hypothetical protein
MASIVGLVVEVVLVVTLVPVIAVYIAGAQNLSTTEKTILGLANEQEDYIFSQPFNLYNLRAYLCDSQVVRYHGQEVNLTVY